MPGNTPSSRVRTSWVFGTTRAKRFRLDVLHPSGSARDNLTERDFRILEIDLAYLGYQVLIGRDLLARCRFMYDGKARRFDLEFSCRAAAPRNHENGLRGGYPDSWRL